MPYLVALVETLKHGTVQLDTGHPVIIQIAINEPRKHLFSLGLEDTLIIFATHFNLEQQKLEEVPSDVFAAVIYCVCKGPRTFHCGILYLNSTPPKYFRAP